MDIVPKKTGISSIDISFFGLTMCEWFQNCWGNIYWYGTDHREWEYLYHKFDQVYEKVHGWHGWYVKNNKLMRFFNGFNIFYKTINSIYIYPCTAYTREPSCIYIIKIHKLSYMNLNKIFWVSIPYVYLLFTRITLTWTWYFMIHNYNKKIKINDYE